MGSNSNVLELLNWVSELGSRLTDGHGLGLLALLAPLFAAIKATDYRRRRREERVWTGAEAAVGGLAGLPLPRGKRAHEKNPALPAVRVRKLSKPHRSISSKKRLWWTPCGELDEPQLVAVAMTGAGKNATIFDPTCWNVLRHRKEGAVVMDVKGDLLRRFAPRVGAAQWIFTFLEDHPSSSAINLIATPRMAASTAAALYPVRHVKVPAFNMGARDLFEALAEAVGYARSNIVELFHCLRDPERMEALAETNDRVRQAISGENRKFVSDVITSARLPLAALSRPEVARVFAPEPHAPQPHFRRKEIAWVCIPQDSEDVALLAGAIVHNLYNRAVKSRRGTYFLVDEAGSTITIENLDRYLQVGRGLGAYFFLVLQDISQLQSKIGEAKTRSVLGNAGVQFWGKSGDPETARYASELSGVVRVQFRAYEHHGGQRAWKQFWSATGAPYRLEDRSRAGLMPEHVHGLPKGWWYVYSGDPTSIELCVPKPMFEWEERVLPTGTANGFRVLAIPDDRESEEPEEGETPVSGSQPPERADEPASRAAGAVPQAEVVEAEEGVEDGARARRACPGCERPVSTTARFCESCGSRL
jgi:hypothetical protein